MMGTASVTAMMMMDCCGGETYSYTYVYDSNTDELTDVYQDGALISHYDYDANGNRTRYTGAKGTFNRTYELY